MEAFRTRETLLTLVIQRMPGWGVNFVEHLEMVVLLVGVASQMLLADEVIDHNEIIAVDEDSWNVTEKEDHNNTHENEGKVDLTFHRVSCSAMCKPRILTIVS